MLRRVLLFTATLLSLAGRAHADSATDDESARWVGGLLSPKAHAAGPDWIAFSARENERWRLEWPRVRTMQQWARDELGPLLPDGLPVVYPFGGPDALHALALFEEETRILLIGLEPVRPLPPVAHGAPRNYFASLDTAMSELHRLTFFRTKELSTDLAQVGVLPPLLDAIVWMGGHVRSVTLAGRDRVSIEWARADDRPRLLEYEQVDLSNGGLARRTDFVAALRARAPYVTFLKAASYLLREARFSYVRQLLIEGSSVVVQDDSGIAFRDLAKDFSFHLFGRYLPPDSPFQDRVQPDLEAEFSRRTPQPLPFGLGYHVAPRSSHLIVATKGGP